MNLAANLSLSHRHKMDDMEPISLFEILSMEDEKKMSNYNINFASNNFGIVEDCHLSLMHFMSQYIRNINFKKSKKIKTTNF